MAAEDAALVKGLAQIDGRLGAIEREIGVRGAMPASMAAAVAASTVSSLSAAGLSAPAAATAVTQVSVAAAVKHEVSARDDFIAGAVAGFVVKALEYPLDTLKVRLQVQAPGATAVGPWTMLRQTVQKDGPRALYKGARRTTYAFAHTACVYVVETHALSVLQASRAHSSAQWLRTRRYFLVLASRLK